VAAALQQFIQWVQALGPAGYVAFIAGYALCCVLLVPASALTLAAGAVFGFAAGSIVVLIGATLGAAAAFVLGRTVLRRRVEGFVASRPKLQAIDRAIAAEGVRLMLLMRVSGFPPFTWINYALSLTGVPFVPYVLTTFFGIIPGVLAFTWAGAAGAKALSGEGNRIALALTAVGAVLVSVYIARIAAQAVRRAQ
jgi:uncharacterized membrane protein YdjX (TVP38/TMEM64 family)